MAGNIVRRPRAAADLMEIWSFIAEDNEAAADRALTKIDGVLTMLASNPLAGRNRSELAANLRSFPIGNYVVFYLPAAAGIEVVRVLNGYLDIQGDDVR